MHSSCIRIFNTFLFILYNNKMDHSYISSCRVNWRDSPLTGSPRFSWKHERNGSMKVSNGRCALYRVSERTPINVSTKTCFMKQLRVFLITYYYYLKSNKFMLCNTQGCRYLIRLDTQDRH